MNETECSASHDRADLRTHHIGGPVDDELIEQLKRMSTRLVVNHTIFLGTSEIRQLVISWATSGVRIE